MLLVGNMADSTTPLEKSVIPMSPRLLSRSMKANLSNSAKSMACKICNSCALAVNAASVSRLPELQIALTIFSDSSPILDAPFLA